MSNCVFCDIVEGKIPAKLVHEDHLAVAFHDVSPKAPTHVLVIPREHVSDLDAATPEQELLLGHLLIVATPSDYTAHLQRDLLSVTIVADTKILNRDTSFVAEGFRKRLGYREPAALAALDTLE